MTARPTARSIATPLARPITGAGDGLSFILDRYAAIGGWSLRKAKASATRNVRMRRSSDNGEQDATFTASGAFDSAAAIAFAGSGSAFVPTAYDQSGNAKTLVQATTTAQPRIINSGVYDDAFVFDGSNDHLSLGTRLTTGSISALTVAYWIRQTTLTYCIDIAEYNAGATVGWGVGNRSGIPSQLQFFDATRGRICWSPMNTLAANTWTHVCWVFDGSQPTEASRMKLYVNGMQLLLEFVGGLPITTTLDATGTIFSLGWINASVFPCGSYRDFFIFQSALNAADVSALYAS